MKHLLLTGASVLALGMAPLMAQEQTVSPSGEANSPYIGVQSEEGGNRYPQARQNRSQGAAADDEGPARDAMGDPPVQPGVTPDMAANDPWSGGMPFPPQDVSDQDLEPGDTPYPSGYPDRAAAGVGEPGYDDQESDSQFVQEGEQIPSDFEMYQGQDMWEADGPQDVDSDRGPSSMAEKRRSDGGEQRLSSERGASSGREGRRAGRQSDRGEFHRDRSETGAVDRSERGGDRGSPRAEGEAMDRDAFEDRRLRAARVALRTARNAVPDARFQTYEFERVGDRRVIEISGTDLDSGRRIEVDVLPNGRVHSISEATDLDAVPDRIRETVREEVGRFRVVHTFRSLRRDLDLYYEFAGFSASGRPAVIEIRADGRDLSVHYLDHG